MSPREPLLALLCLSAVADSGCIKSNSKPARVDEPSKPAPKAAPPAPVAPPTLTAPPLTSKMNARSPLGTNLNGVTYWSPEWIFVDNFKMASTWVSNSNAGWGKGPKLELDEHGWIKRLEPNCRAAAPTPAQGPGDYVLRYEGKGLLGVKGPLKVKLQRPGRIEFEYKGPGHYLVDLVSTDPEDYIRNIQISQKAIEDKLGKETFHPLFIERLRPFKVLRFKDWARVDKQHLVRWADRTPRHFAVQTRGTGVAYEYMIELSNTLGADMWLSVPHKVDDDFIRQLAQLVKAKLNPELFVYLEYSNEVWNSTPSFDQHKWIEARGLEQKLDKNPLAARFKAQAKRSIELFKIFEEVFQGTRRLVRVIGSQTGATWAHERLFELPGSKTHFDALAIAPYFGHEVGQPGFMKGAIKEDMNWLMDHLEKNSLPATLEQLKRSAEFAKNKGVRLLAYEGGQHLVLHPTIHNNKAYTDRMIEAQRHPEMQSLYLGLLEGWKRVGGTLFVNFTYVGAPSKWGYWGALERQDQPLEEAPKYNALVRFSQDNPMWWKR